MCAPPPSRRSRPDAARGSKFAHAWGGRFFMRGSKGSYGLVGLITLFLCGFLVLESTGFAGVAAAQVSINSPLRGSTVRGDVPISLRMGAKTAWVNLFIDG